jgi:hypothetical protein
MAGPITPYSGVVPNPFTQSQPEFDANVQDLVDFITVLPDEINQFTEDLGTGSTNSNSVTSNTIGTGSKSFTVDTGKAYFAGQSLTIARTSAPTNRMFAVVDSYNSGTGALVVTSQAFEGSGTFTDWTITLGFNGVISDGQIPNSAKTDKIQPITASVAANALTITLNPTTLDFRDATLGSGTVNTRTVSAAISVVVSSGSTLGTVNAVQNRLAVLAIDNAGTVELAVVNLAGGVNLDETGVISTTAEGGAGGADSATVIYSTTARTNVPYRVVGFVESTQATAGTWATAPSKIQGYGGQAFAAMSSLGYGQTWQDVAGSRSSGVTYYNTTGKPISVSIFSNGALASTDIELTVNGVVVAYGRFSVSGGNTGRTVCQAIVPPGGSYEADIFGTFAWVELR